jgi:hypothetical protein
MAVGPGSLGEQRREPLHPPVDDDVVDLDAALGQQLLHVAVRQRETQAPAHRQHDHIGRETAAGQARWCDGSVAEAASSHRASLPAQGAPTAAPVPMTVLWTAVDFE